MRRSGFTLVEVLTASVLGSILIGLTATTYIQAERLNVQQSAELEISQNARALIDRISRDVRQTPGFTASLPDNVDQGLEFIQFEDGHDPEAGGPYYMQYHRVDNQVWRRRVYYFRESDPNTRVPFEQVQMDCAGIAGAPAEVAICYNQILEQLSQTNELGDADVIQQAVVDEFVVADRVTSLSLWGESNLLRIDLTFTSSTGVEYPLHSAVAKRN